MPDGLLLVAERVSDAPGGLVAGLQFVSHIVLFFAVVYALRRGAAMLATGAAGLGSLLCSINYHLCRSDLYCTGGLLLDQWRRADHFTALLLAGNLGLALIDLVHASAHGRAWGRLAVYFLPVAVHVAVEFYPYQTRSAVLVVLYVLVAAAARFLTFGHDLTPPDPRHYRTRMLVLTVVLGGGAVGCYTYDGGAPEGNTLLDGLLHALWHVLIGAAVASSVAAVASDAAGDDVDGNGV